MSIQYQCGEFLQFQNQLKKMRDIDDKIVYALNTSIPTESFKGKTQAEQNCRELYSKLKTGYDYREDAIKKCILFYAEKTKKLKEERDKNRGDIQLDKDFKAETRKLRLLQSELSVEDILREKSFRTFSERCSPFYTPENL